MRSLKIVSLLFLIFLGFNSYAQKSKARGVKLSVDRSNVLFKGNKNGFDFTDLIVKYQFVVCKGQISLGIAYDKKVNFTRYWKNGTAFQKGQLKSVKWPLPKQINLDHLEGDLYFGSRKLGKVQLKNIPRFYGGCKRKMFDVMKAVGVNGKDGFYKSNINKLSLQNVKVAEASIVSL